MMMLTQQATQPPPAHYASSPTMTLPLAAVPLMQVPMMPTAGVITDSNGLLRAGVELAGDTWDAARDVFDWHDLDSYVIHQVSQVHTAAITERLGIDIARVPLTFPDLGNIGPASIPTTLAHAAGGYSRGQRVACMGIGSGLNAAVIEIDW
jgi:3-oxoacyl-[acyl-carrier-protein] synthase-3